jgi:hypothetical protein
MQKIDLLVEGEDDVLHGPAIHHVIMGEFHDHGVISTESTLHHPLALENVLFHRLVPGLHPSRPLIRLQRIYNFCLFHAVILSFLDVLQSFYNNFIPFFGTNLLT